jgi:pullulanase/glycogen debranching enzyme
MIPSSTISAGVPDTFGANVTQDGMNFAGFSAHVSRMLLCVFDATGAESDWVVRFYSQRGTVERHIKEGKYTFHWTRLSCRWFRDNEVRLQPYALSCN